MTDEMTTDGGISDVGTDPDLGIEDINWDEVSHSSWIPTTKEVIRFLTFIGIFGLWGYDVIFVPSHESVLVGLNPGNVDWIFGVTLLVGGWYVIVPMIENRRMTRYYWRNFKRNRAAVISLIFLVFIFVMGLIGPIIIGRPELDFANAYQPPVGFGGTWVHPFGTTRTGEDILQITVVGMRVSMQVGLIATAISLLLATAVGTTAAFAGGWIDEALMRFVDLLLTFPTFFLILFLVYIYGGDLFLLIVILSFTGWGGAARLIRSEALQRTEETYIQAAEAVGSSRAWIIRKHIVPNVSNTVITAATLSIPVLILFEAVIAFLGFGDPNIWSWGRIIAQGRGSLQSAWWISTIPGIFLFLTVLAFNFLGDALRDALDPRHEP